MYFKHLSLFFYLFLSFFTFCQSALGKNIEIRSILKLEINGPITPATYDYLASNTQKLSNATYQAMLIKLNTPGGLVTTTKDILTLIGASDYPIIVWITPEGASATSAGALISSGAHLIFMSEGTNIGAATPIEMSGDIKESDGRNKAINDLVALVQSLSDIRNRNGKAFGEMVGQAKSFSAREALKLKIIDGMANNLDELIGQINQREILIKGEKVTLDSSKATVAVQEMELGQKVLSFFANPMMAYILFIIGAALIYLEFQAPGGYIAGGLGVLCLIIAGIGFQILTINIGALILIGLAIILFILEIYVTSFGLLSIAGLAALLTGSVLLFKTEETFIAINHGMMFSVVVGVGLFIAFLSYFFIKDLSKPRPTFFSLCQKEGQVVEILNCDQDWHYYSFKVEGEIWNAKSSRTLQLGEKAKVVEHDKQNLQLTIF